MGKHCGLTLVSSPQVWLYLVYPSSGSARANDWSPGATPLRETRATQSGFGGGSPAVVGRGCNIAALAPYRNKALRKGSAARRSTEIRVEGDPPRSD
ncbi:hypothetical protein ACHAQJ_002287 [Trichoderma viride]